MFSNINRLKRIYSKGSPRMVRCYGGVLLILWLFLSSRLQAQSLKEEPLSSVITTAKASHVLSLEGQNTAISSSNKIPYTAAAGGGVAVPQALQLGGRIAWLRSMSNINQRFPWFLSGLTKVSSRFGLAKRMNLYLGSAGLLLGYIGQRFVSVNSVHQLAHINALELTESEELADVYIISQGEGSISAVPSLHESSKQLSSREPPPAPVLSPDLGSDDDHKEEKQSTAEVIKSAMSLQYEKAWKAFSDLDLSDYFYDKSYALSPDVELMKLNAKFLNYKNSYIRNIIKIFSISLSKYTSKKNLFYGWSRKTLKLFIRTQLASYKEYHLFLSMLFYKDIDSNDAYLSRIYQDSDIPARKKAIIDLLENFSITSPKRHGPLRDKISTKKEFIDMLSDVDIKDLRDRMLAIKTDDGLMFKKSELQYIKKQHIINFIDKLRNPSEKHTYITYIMNFQDSIESLSDHKFVEISKIKSYFKDYILRIVNIEKGDQRRVTHANEIGDSAYDQLINLEESLIKSNLLHLKNKEKHLISYDNMKKIKKEHVIRFVDEKLLDDIDKNMFSLLVLSKANASYIIDKVHNYNFLVEDIIRRISYLSSRFLKYLESNSITEKDSTVNLTYNELDNMYNELTDEEMLHNINKSKAFSKINLYNFENFDANNIKWFVSKRLNSVVDRHLFFGEFLGLDSPKGVFLAKYYDMPNNTLRTKKFIFKKNLLKIFESGLDSVAGIKNYPYVDSILTFSSLQDVYLRLMNNSFNEISSRVNNYAKVKRGIEVDIRYLNKKNIQFFHDTILDTDIKKHLFYSIVLSLDKSRYDNIIDIYGRQYSSLRTSKRVAVNKLIDIISNDSLNGVSVDFLLNPEKSTDFNYIKNRFDDLTSTKLVTMIKKNIKDFYSPRYHAQYVVKEAHNLVGYINKKHIDSFMFYYLKNDEMKWFIYITQVLNIGNVKVSEINEKYYLAKDSVGPLKKYMIETILNITKLDVEQNIVRNLPIVDKVLSIEELRDKYLGYSHDYIARRLHANLKYVSNRFESHIKKIVITKSNLENFYKNELNTVFKEHIFLSKIFLLDSHSDEDMAKLYNVSTQSFRKRVHVIRNFLFMASTGGYSYLGSQGKTVSKKTEDIFNKDHEKYMTLSDDDQLALIYRSAALKDYPDFHHFFTKDVYRRFFEVNLLKIDNKNHKMNRHIFYCLVLGICDTDKVGISMLYKVRENQVGKIYRKLINSIRYTMYASQPSLRIMLYEKNYYKEFAQIYDPYSRKANIFPVLRIKTLFHNLHEDDAHLWFEHLNISDNDLKITKKVMDIFLQLYVKSDLDWHILFYFILYFDYVDQNYLASIYSLDLSDLLNRKQHLLDILKVISQAPTGSFDDTDIYLRDHQIIDVANAPYRLELWKVKDMFRNLSNEEIVDKVLDSNFVFRSDPDFKRKIVSLKDSHSKEIVEQIYKVLKYRPVLWHCFLSVILKLDNTKSFDFKKLYGYNSASIFSIKSRLNKQIEDAIKSVFE